MPATVSQIIKAVEVIAPPGLKYGDDPTGFQLGDTEAQIDRVLFCLEITEQVIEEALDQGAGLIISHHPLIFRPVKRLVLSDPLSAVIFLLIKSNLAVYSAHTSLDRALWGVSDALAEVLGLSELSVLVPADDLSLFKLVVFVPTDHLQGVAEAIARAGGGAIGGYSHCTFRSSGIGTFKPGLGAHPAVGEVGKVNEVSEIKLETIVPPDRLGSVVSAMLAAHPYEEVAYDIYKLENPQPEIGFGRVGTLEEEATVRECVERWSRKLGASLRVAGDLDKKVKRIAVCGGSGGELIGFAAAKADLFLTGDVKHHAALDAIAADIPVIDAGHYATEIVAINGFAGRVGGELKRRGLDAELVVSSIKTDPWQRLT